MNPSFLMPAEWEQHEATWLAWPHEETDWPSKFDSIPWVYGEIVRHLSRSETIRILVQNQESEEDARRVLQLCHADLKAVEFFPIPTDRSWTRDYCPTFVRRGEQLGMLDWRFTGWAKYENSSADDAVTRSISEAAGYPVWSPLFDEQRIVLEGGSIDVNGTGSILTTEECLLSNTQVRNPRFSRQTYEQIFCDYLGASNVLWLRNGIVGDDTHGHVDDLARFVSAETIVIASEKDPRDENYEPLLENLRLAREMKDVAGRRFRVETLPMPQPVVFDGQRLPASYANFYISNKIVLVPTFNDVSDRIALNKLAELFPGRDVIGIGCSDLILGLGALHCMTQQQPAIELE
jgi:agmatine deiminase